MASAFHVRFTISFLTNMEHFKSGTTCQSSSELFVSAMIKIKQICVSTKDSKWKVLFMIRLTGRRYVSLEVNFETENLQTTFLSNEYEPRLEAVTLLRFPLFRECDPIIVKARQVFSPDGDGSSTGQKLKGSSEIRRKRLTFCQLNYLL